MPVQSGVIRLLDIIFAAAALLVLSPVLLVIMLLLRFTGEGEVFYGQTRTGMGRDEFKLWKFATMLKNSPNIGTGVLTVKNDPRVLPFGGFLRKTKLNELPQLFNVLTGEMSLIGPRPQVPSVFAMYPANLQEKLSRVKPGLSGIGSVMFRDEESIVEHADDKTQFYANIISPYKAELESWFAGKQSVWLYFVLIFMTAWVVVFPKSRLPWRMLTDLPHPPVELQSAMSFQG